MNVKWALQCTHQHNKGTKKLKKPNKFNLDSVTMGNRLFSGLSHVIYVRAPEASFDI